eukprot:Seg1680.8 transcript_id=Seg1680.8/GoldUCD/mRNA.D3Y31 product="Mitochondrial RNA pseudouridine synthase Rpusd4" protein_id=Seg1680.8/GoldUCD/D3Y31
MSFSWSVVKRWKELIKAAKSIRASDLEVLYKRDGLLAISKPYGIAVHAGPGQGKCVLDLMDEFRELHGLKETPQLLHRLDKNSSGLLLFAYDKDMAAKISELFEQRKIHKTYLGVTSGVPSAPSGVIIDKICEGVVGKQKRRRMVTTKDLSSGSQVYPVPDAEMKKAFTAYTVLDHNESTCALVKFMTKTGIKHQIRIHSASSLECPLLGDHKFSSFNAEPQMLPLRLLQLLEVTGVKSNPEAKARIQPWQRALIPLHLFAESAEIPEISTGAKSVLIKATIPQFFSETLEKCDLHPKRQHMKKYSEKQKLKHLYKM